MRRFIWASSYLMGGIAAGCLSAFALIQSSGVEAVEAGTPWLSRTAALADQQAFYVRAHYLLEGRLPPAGGQLTEATAETDGDGRPLTGSCVYTLTSTAPLPRWWSIGMIGGAEGKPLQATADSDSAVAEPGGMVRITASRTPQPGNWVKAPDQRRFVLLYSALAAPHSDSPPFKIERGTCR